MQALKKCEQNVTAEAWWNVQINSDILPGQTNMLQSTIDGKIVAEIPIVTGTCDTHCTELNSSLGKMGHPDPKRRR